MKLKIETTITTDDNITGDEIEHIKDEFEELAWNHDISIYQPSVKIQEV